MDELTHSSTDSINTVTSVLDLATDLDKCKAWLDNGQTNSEKIVNVLTRAVYAGHSDICQLILDRKRLAEAVFKSTNMIAVACYSGHLSVVRLIASRCRPSMQQLYTGLTNACACGYDEIVTWLLGEINVRWLLVAASARGDIDTVRVLAVQTGVTSTEAMSQALRAACYQGKVEVVDWLTMYTTADVSLRGDLGVGKGSMTSLTPACHEGHVDIVVTLLKCVTPHTINVQCGKYNDSALHSVICFSNAEYFSHSLHGACTRDDIDGVNNAVHDTNVNTTNLNGLTPLHVVCRSGSVEIIQTLLSVFARVDITDSDGRTPIKTANHYGNTELVPYMSQLLDATNYTPSSSTVGNVTSVSSVTRPTVDVIVNDARIVACDVRSIVQPCAQRNAANHSQQQRQSVKVAISNCKSRFKIV